MSKATAVSSAGPSATPGIGRASVSGAMHMLGSAGVVKLATIGCQILLGWLLLPQDYAVFAIANSTAAMFSVFQKAGIQEILIQQQKNHDRLAGTAMFLALAMSTAVAVILMVLAFPLSQKYAMPELKSLFQVIALALPITAAAEQACVQLQIQMRFREIARVETMAGVVLNLLMALFAWCGMGPLSFVYPLVAVAILRLVAYAKLAPHMPRPDVKSLRAAYGFLKAGTWVILGAISMTIAEQGQFLVISRLASPEVLGAYYFGFRLADQTRSLMGFNMGKVLMASFSKINESRCRIQNAFLLTVRSANLVILPLSVLIALTAPCIETLVWHGKWASAMLAAQLITVSTPMAILSIIGRTSMKSTGCFRLWAITGWMDALGTMSAALIGTLGKSVLSIAVAIAAYKAVMGLLQLLIGSRCISVGGLRVANQLWRAYLIAAAAALPAFLGANALVPQSNPAAKGFFLAAVFSGVYFIGTLLVNRPAINDLLEKVGKQKR